MLDVMAPGIERAPRRGRCGSPTPSSSRRGTRGKLTHEMRQALRDTAALLSDLGHEVVERDLDFRARDIPVILALHVPRDPRHRRRDRARRSGSSGAPATSRGPGAGHRIGPSTGCSSPSSGSRARIGAAVGRVRRAADADPGRARGHRRSRWRAAARPRHTCGRAAWVPFGVLWNSTGQPAASVPAGFAARRAPAGRPARRPPARRGHAAGAFAGDRGRAAMGTSPSRALSLASVPPPHGGLPYLLRGSGAEGAGQRCGGDGRRAVAVRARGRRPRRPAAPASSAARSSSRSSRRARSCTTSTARCATTST